MLSRKPVAIITSPACEPSDVFFRGLGPGEAERIESEQLELRAAGRAGEDLAAVDVEIGHHDRMLTDRAGGPVRGVVGRCRGQGTQLKSIFTTRVVLVPPHSTIAEKETTQKLRSIPDSVLPDMSRLRG
jgi:hypothetical protein